MFFFCLYVIIFICMGCYLCIYVISRFTTSDPLQSRSTGFEAGQRIQFQSWSDLNWLAVLTESVYKLELHAATVIGMTLR